MERKPVTLTEDLSQLLDGSIQAGEFSGRSAAIRRCLQEYFRDHPIETAALLVADNNLDVEAVAETLDLDHKHLRERIMAIDQSRAPTSTDTVFEDIVGDFELGKTDDDAPNRAPLDETEHPTDR